VLHRRQKTDFPPEFKKFKRRIPNFDDASFSVFENHFSRTTGVDASLRHGNFKEVSQKADSAVYKTFQRLPFAISPTIIQNIPGC